MKTRNLCFEQNYEKYQFVFFFFFCLFINFFFFFFLIKKFQFLEFKLSIHSTRRVFVMISMFLLKKMLYLG